MLFLVLLQSLLITALIGLVVYWKLQTNRSLDQIALGELARAESLLTMQTAISHLQIELAEVKQREPKAGSYQVETQQASNALSIGKRSQALKLIRRGESIESVAAAVGVPHSQIRLLQKVNAMLDQANA